jgi:WxcM-like protein
MNRPALVRLSLTADARGELCFGEWGRELPFEPKRFFSIRAVPPTATRGDHAHRRQQQLLVCLEGACTLRVDDGESQQSFRLDSPAVAVHAPPLTWCTLTDFAPGSVLLVLASDRYDADEYIRDYQEFLRLTRSR